MHCMKTHRALESALWLGALAWHACTHTHAYTHTWKGTEATSWHWHTISDTWPQSHTWLAFQWNNDQPVHSVSHPHICWSSASRLSESNRQITRTDQAFQNKRKQIGSRLLLERNLLLFCCFQIWGNFSFDALNLAALFIDEPAQLLVYYLSPVGVEILF